MYRHHLQVLLHCLHGQFHHLNLPHIWILCPGSGLCLCCRKWCQFQSWCSGWCYFPGWCCHYCHLQDRYCLVFLHLLMKILMYGHTIYYFFSNVQPPEFLHPVHLPELYRYTYHSPQQTLPSSLNRQQLSHWFLHTNNHSQFH